MVRRFHENTKIPQRYDIEDDVAAQDATCKDGSGENDEEVGRNRDVEGSNYGGDYACIHGNETDDFSYRSWKRFR